MQVKTRYTLYPQGYNKSKKKKKRNSSVVSLDTELPKITKLETLNIELPSLGTVLNSTHRYSSKRPETGIQTLILKCS